MTIIGTILLALAAAITELLAYDVNSFPMKQRFSSKPADMNRFPAGSTDNITGGFVCGFPGHGKASNALLVAIEAAGITIRCRQDRKVIDPLSCFCLYEDPAYFIRVFSFVELVGYQNPVLNQLFPVLFLPVRLKKQGSGKCMVQQ